MVMLLLVGMMSCSSQQRTSEIRLDPSFVQLSVLRICGRSVARCNGLSSYVLRCFPFVLVSQMTQQK